MQVTELAPKELQYVTAVPFDDAVYKVRAHWRPSPTDWLVNI